MQLHQLLRAHSLVGGHGPGRRFSTEQINHASVTALSGQFQGFARDLLHEAIDALLNTATQGSGSSSGGALRLAVQAGMTSSLALDRNNPTRQSIDVDFRRIGIQSLAEEVGRTRLPGKRPW
jgi:hypothetical protein